MHGGTFDGGPGSDRVDDLYDGTFAGGGGDCPAALSRAPSPASIGCHGDAVIHMHGGTFWGGPGLDQTGLLSGGTIHGGAGQDIVSDMRGGAFHGDDDKDRVAYLREGLFDGGSGIDDIDWCVDSPPAVLIDVENVPDRTCAPA